jgi:ribosome-associated protein
MLNDLPLSPRPTPREKRMDYGRRAMTHSSSGETLTLRGEHITLAHAVKAVGLADTGGQAKHLVRAGSITVNGEAATQPGRKLRAGDRFGIAGGSEWTITT